MLSAMGINNFKPFGPEQTARLAPITLIYGPNSGGKSSIIQSLMLLKQTMDGSPETAGLIPQGSLVNLGSYKALVNRHELKKNVVLRFSFDRSRESRREGHRALLPRDATRHVQLAYASAKSRGSRKSDSSELSETRYSLGKLDDNPILDLRLKRTAKDPSRLEALPINLVGEQGLFTWKDESSCRSLIAFILSEKHRYQSVNRGPQGTNIEDEGQLPSAEDLSRPLMRLWSPSKEACPPGSFLSAGGTIWHSWSLARVPHESR